MSKKAIKTTKKIGRKKTIKYKKIRFTKDVGNGVFGAIAGVEMWLVKRYKGKITVCSGPDSDHGELVFDIEDKDYEIIE